MLVTLLSAKGSPGVTTTAAALAAVGAEDRARADDTQELDLVELDPSGGDLEPLTSATGEPGLLRAVTDLGPASLAEHAVDAPPGVRSLLAPTSGFEAAATIAAGASSWAAALSAVGGVVVVDAGRWEPAGPSATRISGSDVVAVVCRPDLRGVEHARHVIRLLKDLAPAVSLIAVGHQPYGIAEIAEQLGVHAAGTIAWDPGGAAALWAEGIIGGQRRFRAWTKSWLARSARSVLAELVTSGKAVMVP